MTSNLAGINEKRSMRVPRVFPEGIPVNGGGGCRPAISRPICSRKEVIMSADTASVTRGIPGEVREHLQRHHVVTLSTSSFTGMPHADTVVYASDSRSIFFFAGEGTQMLRNI